MPDHFSFKTCLRVPLCGISVMCLGLFLFACDTKQRGAQDADASPDMLASDMPSDVPDAAAEQEQVKVTAADVAPVFLTSGAENEVPDYLAVRSKIALAPNKSASLSLEQNQLLFVPEVQGKLTRGDDRSLSFTPENGFLPGTTYNVRLTSISVNDEVIQPDNPWTYSFTTPKFEFLRMSSPVRTGEDELQATLYFSAPPKDFDLKRFGTWKLSNKKPSSVSYQRGEGGNTIRVTIKDRALTQKRDHEVTLKLAAGLPFSDDITAPAASASAMVLEGKPMEIMSAYHQEGSSGFYIDVICDDDADSSHKRYYWDRVNYRDYRISLSCEPTLASAREKIRFNPPVDVEISPSRGGFRIFGDFKQGVYTMQVEPGLLTQKGGILRKNFEHEFTIPERSPTLGFVSKGRFIPTEAWDKISYRSLNVDKVAVEIKHIPAENLHFWLSGSDESASSRVANVVARQELALKLEPNKEEISLLDVKKIIPDPKPGVYEINITNDTKEDKDSSSRRSKKIVRDTSRLLITDMNLIAKQSAPKPDEPFSDEIHVWTFGMRDLKPRIGAEVQAIRPSGDVLARCRTDVQGGCVLNLRTDDVDKTPPFALIAKQDEDFTYISFEQLQTKSVDEADTQGVPYLSKDTYSVAAYGDRDLYRPGGLVHLAAVVRQEKNWRAPAKNVPVEVVLRDPRARVVLRKVIKTNGAGALAVDYQLADFAPTGRWNATLNIGKKQVQTYSFNVEEFVPERMRVKAKFDRDYVVKGEVASLDVEANYLFGGSAEGSKVEVNCSVVPDTFKPKKNKEYTYGSQRRHKDVRRLELGVSSSTLDAKDKATLSCPSQEALEKLKVPGKILASVSVFEAGSGRTTSKRVQAPYFPASYQVGLKSNVKKIKQGKAFDVQGVVVNPEGEPYTSIKSLDVELIQLISEYGWTYDENYGYERYTWYQREVLESSQKVTPGADGSFKVTFTPKQDASNFVVRVRSSEVVTDLELQGVYRYYYWYSDSSSNNTPTPEKAASVVIDAPKRIEVGQVADVSFEAPFKGRALLTVETDRVIKQEWREVEAGENTFSFKLKNFYPNVYVGALIIKDPHLDSKDAFLPGRAMGMHSIKVSPTEFSHNVKIKTPKEVRSESELEVHVDLGQQQEETWVTVSVVDEGILSLTSYKSPNLHTKIFTHRALGVDTFDTVGWGLQLESMKGQTGGGDDYEEEPSVDKSNEDNAGLGRPKAIKPVALWSGLVKLPRSGRLTVPFKLPLYRGSLRVMVNTMSASKLGNAEAEVLVRDPINVQSTLPRFLSHQDEVHVPVFVTNTSGNPQKINVSFSAEEQPLEGMSKAVLPKDKPLVEQINPADQVLELADGKSGTVIFRIKALRQSGVANFKVLAKAGDLQSHDKATVPFVPAGPRERKVTRLEITDTTTDLSSVLEGWEPTSENSTFWLTTLPYGDAFDHLKFLVRYPYGCIEQTTSSTRPLLFVGDILEQVAPSIAPNPDEVTKMVQHGIRRVFSMQTSSGGFGYWPGSRYPDAWGTAYASHMLIDARDAGYDVSSEQLDLALDWLEDNVSKRSYNYAEPYMHYVLALSGRGKKGRIKKLIELMPGDPSGEDAEKLYLLQAALYKMGDQRYKDDLLAPDVSSLASSRRYGYSYYSDRRRRAMVLNTFYELFGADERGEALMNLVGRSLSEKASYWYTTQELVWGITALGKWSKGAAKNIGEADLLVNNASFKPAHKGKGSSGVSWSLMRASEYDSVMLKLDNKPEGKLYLIVSSEGVRTNPELTYGGDGIALTRSYYDADGNSIALNDIKLGDVVYSQLRITNQTNSSIQNVALVERLPAGWEVENTNLNGRHVPAVLKKDAWGHEHMNVRDDRVEVFNTLRAKQSATVTIAVRATSAGVFTAPSAYAEAMYDPSKWARVRPIEMKIIGPWKDGSP